MLIQMLRVILRFKLIPVRLTIMDIVDKSNNVSLNNTLYLLFERWKKPVFTPRRNALGWSSIAVFLIRGTRL